MDEHQNDSRDVLIEQAARQLVTGEAPARLRAAVLSEIHEPPRTFPWAILWSSVGLLFAAGLVFVVTTGRNEPPIVPVQNTEVQPARAPDASPRLDKRSPASVSNENPKREEGERPRSLALPLGEPVDVSAVGVVEDPMAQVFPAINLSDIAASTIPISSVDIPSIEVTSLNIAPIDSQP